MTNHLKLVPEHEHDFKPYTLSDEYGIFYSGHRCECGEAGYAMPMKDPSGFSVMVTRQEWHDHLDEEHEDDRQDRS